MEINLWVNFIIRSLLILRAHEPQVCQRWATNARPSKGAARTREGGGTSEYGLGPRSRLDSRAAARTPAMLPTLLTFPELASPPPLSALAAVVDGRGS